MAVDVMNNLGQSLGDLPQGTQVNQIGVIMNVNELLLSNFKLRHEV